MYSFFLIAVIFFKIVNCFNFPFESIQLNEREIGNFSAISFGDKSKIPTTFANTKCRAYPGTPGWPNDSEWQLLNASLSGALLKPIPAAAVCYPGPLQDINQCNYLIRNASSARFYINDPLTVLTAWPQGNTCDVTLSPPKNATCTQGGFPTYVVNATTVKQIQIAVNFARNKNIRLIIKNTGHDFLGRSVGAGSLSIWTHHLKNFEFLSEYSQGPYSDIAARVGAGLESWELYQYMDKHNMTLVVPGDTTVGAYGGWLLGGGHNILASKYGLGADQPLSLQVVTADGRFVVASPEENEDLFYALRGGGPATFGVVTSAIVKAYPHLQVPEISISFMGGNSTSPPTNTSTPGPVIVSDLSTFWAGVNAFFKYGTEIVDNGGTTYNYVSKLSNTSYSFRANIDLPGLTNREVNALAAPLNARFHALGIQVNTSAPAPAVLWAGSTQGKGDAPGNFRFASRLFPRSNWDDEAKFNTTMAAIRSTVETGYFFHGIHMGPTTDIAGYPGNNGVNPAFRNTIMHADSYDISVGVDAETRHNASMNLIREVTPQGGSYVNEADVQEPNWQHSFWGAKYEILSELKREWDPWGVFWAPATVGSEGWEVENGGGLPTQNGRLCRTK